ncbi:SMI1/KNR4 family protein [Paenibacillus shenyangensis]|uniref:SMI1/KNR4 family protein n=1 Tax=Paenibacillus sp. A9 TaxID=1284352 RepID=UPI0003826AA6|nr:SMI1/KNR4 family protein [Paenibacillus sp. A9]
MIGTWIEEIKSILRPELNSLEDFLLPPAGDVEIAQAEQAMGVTFPDELRQLYHIHNGESRNGPGLFFGLQFLSLDDMVSEWKIWSDLQPQYQELGDHYSIPSGWIKEQYINKGWIPFCHDGGGNHLGIDLDPAEKGITGQIINFGRDEEMKHVIAPSLGAFIHFMRDTVREGNYTVVEEEGMGYWMYGRNEQSRLLKDAQTYAMGDIIQQPEGEESEQLDTWFASLDPVWRNLITEGHGDAESFVTANQIYLPDAQLSDISPLSRCLQVRELLLNRNEIEDITPLASCRELKNLHLFRNPVRDLSPLQNLPYLQILNIEDTQVQDLRPLTNLSRLYELDCRGTAVQDYSPLAQLTTLHKLAISAPTREAAAYISSLPELCELTILGADEWQEEDWEQLGRMLPLRKLYIGALQDRHIRYLGGYAQLESLTLYDSRIDDISALADLPALKELKLMEGCQIGNLESIGRSVTLEKFTGTFAQFELLKDAFAQYVNFSQMIGEMTEEQHNIWIRHTR